MSSKVSRFLLSFIILILILLGGWEPTHANQITIIGEVNDSRQVVTDDQVYDVEEDKIGSDLVLNYIAQKVKVTGIVIEETADMKVIKVTSFEVVPE